MSRNTCEGILYNNYGAAVCGKQS